MKETEGDRSHSSAPAERGEPAPPLEGLQVLDLCSMIAGPVCARTLAEYGADVIKIVSPRPLHGPRMTCWYGMDVDQGKKSILLDLKSDAGRAVFRRLVERADVLVHNLSRDAAERLGLRYEDLEGINPRIVCCAVGAYDGPAEGTWAGRKGYDPVAQAAAGIMTRYGSRDRPEHHAIASCVDYLTGYSAAFAVALGVFTQMRDPAEHGTSVKSSLAQSAQLIQAPFAFCFDGRQWSEPQGQDALGDHPLHRMYRATDGWLFLGARPEQSEQLMRSLGLASLADDPESGHAVTAALERSFRTRPVAVWARELRSHDIALVKVRTLEEIRKRMVAPHPGVKFTTGGPTVQIVRQDHPVGCLVDTLAPAYARFRRSPVRFVDPAPRPGSHTLEILGTLGYSGLEIETLLENGVAAEALSSVYLPD